jgi:hypothetical protein
LAKNRDFEYKTYLASREWAVRREAVRKRSSGSCERCWDAPMTATHHRTYANIGAEPLEDLQAVCGPCHTFLSGKSDHDPRDHFWAEFVSVFLAAAMLGGEVDVVGLSLEDRQSTAWAARSMQDEPGDPILFGIIQSVAA